MRFGLVRKRLQTHLLGFARWNRHLHGVPHPAPDQGSPHGRDHADATWGRIASIGQLQHDLARLAVEDVFDRDPGVKSDHFGGDAGRRRDVRIVEHFLQQIGLLDSGQRQLLDQRRELDGIGAGCVRWRLRFHGIARDRNWLVPRGGDHKQRNMERPAGTAIEVRRCAVFCALGLASRTHTVPRRADIARLDRVTADRCVRVCLVVLAGAAWGRRVAVLPTRRPLENPVPCEGSGEGWACNSPRCVRTRIRQSPRCPRWFPIGSAYPHVVEHR